SWHKCLAMCFRNQRESAVVLRATLHLKHQANIALLLAIALKSCLQDHGTTGPLTHNSCFSISASFSHFDFSISEFQHFSVCEPSWPRVLPDGFSAFATQTQRSPGDLPRFGCDGA